MVLYLFRLILTALILLERSFDCSRYPEISYVIYDGLGEPTSFLYENGWVEARCEAPSSNPNINVQLRADIKDSDVVLEQGNGSVSMNVSLKNFDYEKIFCYSKTKASESKLAISYRLCDPMLLIPPITTCGEKEVCLKTASSTSRCGQISELACDLEALEIFEKNLPIERYICVQAVVKHKQGLCQAMKSTSGNEQFSGFTLINSVCNNYKVFKLYDKIAAEGSFWFTSITSKEFKAEFTKILGILIEAHCFLATSENGVFLLANGSAKNLSQEKNQDRTLVLSLDLSVIKPSILPMKAKLTCSVSTDLVSRTKSTSVYLFLFDEKKFFPAIKTTLIDANTGLYSLNCEAKMVDGILFSVSWDREPNTYFAKTSEDKIIVNKFDDSAQKHTCYLAAFAYNYPYKVKLVKLDLPSGSVNNSVEIEKGGAPGKCLYDTEHKTPGFCDGNAGSGTVKLDKDMMHHAAGKSAKETSVDLSHDSHFQKWEQV